MESTPPRSLYGIGPYREYAFPVIALLMAAFLPFPLIASAFVVVGHAHFLMAYRYQYKGKKMNLLYIIVAILTLLGSSLYFATGGTIIPILVVAGILFAFHFALDEFTLHNEPLTTKSMLTGLGFAALYSALVAVVAFPQLKDIGLVVSILIAIGILVRVVRSRSTITPAERYLWIVQGVLFILAVVLNFPDRIIGVVLLLHFANWYMGYAGKVKGNPARAKEYWYTFALTLIVPFVLFIGWKAGYLPMLTVFFGLAFYYAWAIAHIVLSFVAMRQVRA